MPLPSNSSISLQGHSRPGEGVTTMPKIAMVVRMTEETLDALQSLSGADRMDFEFGDKPGIYVRDQCFPMRYDREKENQELFIRTTMPNRPNAPLRLNANVVGKFAVEKVLSNKISQRLHHATAAAQKQKAERKAKMMDAPPAVTPPVAQKPAPKRKAPPKSAPKSTPTIVKSYATTSPNPTASPNGSASVALPKDLATTYRQRLIHYLALGSATVQDIFKEFGGSEIDHNTRAGIMDLLHDVAEREEVSRKAASTTQLANWRLKPQTWLEVRPYQYSGYTDNVRTKVARTARTWFGSLKIPEDDPAWDHVKFRDSGHGNSGSNAQSGQRAMNGTTSAAAKAKKAKATSADVKVKSEAAAPSPRPSASLPPKPSGVSMRASTPMRSAKGKEREGETEKEEGELSASQTPPRMSAIPAERRQPNSRPSNGASTPTMPPPPVPVSFQSQQLSSSVAAKRTGPVDPRGLRRPPPEPSERARAAPPLPPPVDRKPVVQVKKEVVAQTKKERASVSLSENGVATSSASSQSAKERDRELARRERERDKESDRESIRAARKERERESDRESIRGRDEERALKEIARDRDQERPREKLKEKASAPSRAVAKTSTKRKPPSESSAEESSDWGYEDRRRSSVKLKRDRESIAAKSTSSSLRAPVALKQKIKRETSPLPSTKVKSIPVERRVVSASSSKASSTAVKKMPKVDGVSRSTSVKLHKRRRSSIDFTSSSEEEEERKPRNSVSTVKPTLTSKSSAAANITSTIPSKPRPALSKREQLRSRYQNIYGEYIMVFQKLVAHKNRVQAVLRHGSESPSGESDIDLNDMMPLDEVKELTARHQRLHDELEEIKKSYMT
ncbi:hypothetical protein ACEPAG_7836 [Sanghuangporus baumii]